MVEGACLENRLASDRYGGSNPSLTAKRTKSRSQQRNAMLIPFMPKAVKSLLL